MLCTLELILLNKFSHLKRERESWNVLDVCSAFFDVLEIQTNRSSQKFLFDAKNEKIFFVFAWHRQTATLNR